ALEGVAVGVRAVDGLARQPLVGAAEIARDDAPHPGLRPPREVGADVFEQRANGSLEVMAIRRHPLDRALAGLEHRCVRALRALSWEWADVRSQLAIDSAAELVHGDCLLRSPPQGSSTTLPRSAC